MLQTGSRAWYRRQTSSGVEDWVLATILSVHYDDSPPYYTVLLDGVERETVRERLEEIEERPRKRQQFNAAVCIQRHYRGNVVQWSKTDADWDLIMKHMKHIPQHDVEHLQVCALN